MFSNLLLSHGYFCASHPWEIIVTTFTVTICSLSMAIYMGSDKICDWNYKCAELDEKSSDIIILTFTKCVAIFYIYLQFKKLRKLGSKYILGLAGLFTIFSSFVISATAINYLNIDLAFIKESIPFFLLLIDLSKASTLGKFSLNYSSYGSKPKKSEDGKDDHLAQNNYQTHLAKESIAKGMAILGPSFTLDTLVEIMVVGIGTMSGIKTLEMACLFGCISILANYFIFMTFYPACLSLVLEMSVTNLSQGDGKDYKISESVLNDSTESLDQSRNHAKATQIPSHLNKTASLSPRPPRSFLRKRPLLDDSNFWKITFLSPANSSDATANYDESTISEDNFLSDYHGVGEGSAILKSKSSHLSNGSVPKDSAVSNILIGNPVIQRIKIIMSLGLLVVHIHSRLMVEKTGKYLQFATSVTNPVPSVTGMRGHDLLPDTPSPPLASSIHDQGFLTPQNSLWLFWITRIFDLKVQDWVTILFALFTTLHYLYYDSTPRANENGKGEETRSSSKARNRSASLSNNKHPESVGGEDDHKSGTNCKEDLGDVLEDSTLHPEPQQVSFIVGETVYEALIEDKETQTDFKITFPAHTQTTIAAQTDYQISYEDDKLVQLLLDKKIASHTLDIHTGGDCLQSVRVRRKALNAILQKGAGVTDMNPLLGLPYSDYTDYGLVNGACCENVIGYLPIPLGFAGPLMLNGTPYYLPMATTEGCLVASTNRGCRAIEQSEKGVISRVYNNGMTRGPVVRFPSASRAVDTKFWLEEDVNFAKVKGEFEATSRFLTLVDIQTTVAGRLLFLRFRAITGDAMGMNMTSKACDAALKLMSNLHPDMEILSLSGNYCTDKKAAAINWIEGRGKSVVCEAIIPQDTIIRTLKTTVAAMIELNNNKNLIGSAMAGSIGGFNAHAANIVASMFIATGQDPAQVITSANCITIMEYGGPNNQDLRISCTMPSLETGTIGGGTILSAQKSCLKMLGVDGPNINCPGENASKLATIICGGVLAGELSLMAALSAGHLVKSHLKYNRSQKNCASS